MAGAQSKHRPPFMKPSNPYPDLSWNRQSTPLTGKIRHNLYGKTLQNGTLPPLIDMRHSNYYRVASSLQGATATSTDGGAQDEQEEPQAVSTKGAGESTNKSEPEPDPMAASAGKDVDAAVEEFEGTDPVSPIVRDAVDGVGGTNAAFTEIQHLSDTYLRSFKIHPYSQTALGILYAVSQLFLSQANLDKAVFDLLDAAFPAEQDRMSNIDKGTLGRIARTISDSAHFVQDYSAIKSFLWYGSRSTELSDCSALT
ncbi:hypothetical protein EDD16DRAFT_1711725 [Pisolithus croceorrhizus]|nr:hypothetical protein EDD16DRAFT_1711725 [Pisolithus croceorrhizus]